MAKIDEKLNELYAALEQFSSLTDKTKAVNELVAKFASVGKEQLDAAEARLTEMCDEVIESVKKAASVPAKIKEATSALDGKSFKGVERLEQAVAEVDRSAGDCVNKVEQAALSLKRTATSSGEVLEKKIKDAIEKSPLADLVELQQRIENIEQELVAIKQVQNGLVEAQKTAAKTESSIKATLDEVKSMVALIPTKRGLFG